MTLSDIAAIIGMITGVAALILNWRTRLEARLDKRPIVSIAPSKSGGSPKGWHRYTVTMRSRTNMRYSISRISVLWPPSLRIAPRKACETYNRDGTGGVEIIFHEPANSGRTCDFLLEVAPEGAQGYRQPWGGIKMGTKEEDHEDFFLSTSSSRSSTSFLSRYDWFSTSFHWRKAWLSLKVTDEHATARERRVAITLPVIRNTGSESRN